MPTPNDFSRFDFGKSGASSGEFGQAAQAPVETTTVGTYPIAGEPDIESREVSSDVNGDPQALYVAAEPDRAAFEELQRFLMNSLQTPGSRVACPMNMNMNEEAPEPGAEKEGTE